MNTLQKMAIKANAKKMLSKNATLLKVVIDVNYITKIATVEAFGENSENKISESKKLEFEESEFSQFGDMLTGNLKKFIKYKELNRVIINVDYVGKESFYEMYYISENGNKEFFKTEKQ